MWDLASENIPPQRLMTLRFDAPVLSACFHPRNRYATSTRLFNHTNLLNSNIILALMATGEAYLVDSRKEHRGRVELCDVQEDSDDEGQSPKHR